LIDFIAEVKDEYGLTVTNLRDKVDIKLSDQTAAELARRPIEYDAGFTLLPGRYRIKFLARDGETGRMGVYEMPFAIPNLNREVERIALSSVILSGRRVELADALYGGKKQKDQQAQVASPLVDGQRKLIPSVTRVFSKSKEMFLYLEAYQQGEEPAHPLAAYVTFFQDGEKRLETEPVEVRLSGDDRLGTMRFRFGLQLDSLRAGQYECQVSVLDFQGRKAGFWQAPVMVVP
jgi:hypothetical protein